MKQRTKFLIQILITVMLAGCLSITAPAAESTASLTLLTEPRYQLVKPVSHGFLAIYEKGKWGYADDSGTVIISPRFEYAAGFHEGKALVGIVSGDSLAMGTVGPDGVYHALRRSNGTQLYALPEQLFETVIDESGARIPDYTRPLDFGYMNGYLYLADSASGAVLFDYAGTELPLVSPQGVISGLYSDGMFTAVGYEEDGSPLFRFVDAAGNVKVSFSGSEGFVNVYEFYNGYAAAWKQNAEGRLQFALVTAGGDTAFTGGYDRFARISSVGSTGNRAVSCGRIVLRLSENQKWGALDTAGNICVPFQYDRMYSYSEGRSLVLQNGLWGYVDTAGNPLIPPQYTAATPFAKGIALAVTAAGDTVLLDRQGNHLTTTDALPAGLLADATVPPDGIMPIEQDGLYGVARLSCSVALPAASELSGWAYNEVTAAIKDGLIPLELQNQYGDNITREEFANLAICALEAATGSEVTLLPGEEISTAMLYAQNPFKDCWNINVLLANRLGIINGTAADTFTPGRAISRQEAAALLTRLARLISGSTAATGVRFADEADIADYAKDAVRYVTSMNIMNGVGENRFAPLAPYTREQAFLTIYRLFRRDA